MEVQSLHRQETNLYIDRNDATLIEANGLSSLMMLSAQESIFAVESLLNVGRDCGRESIHTGRRRRKIQRRHHLSSIPPLQQGG